MFPSRILTYLENDHPVSSHYFVDQSGQMQSDRVLTFAEDHLS